MRRQEYQPTHRNAVIGCAETRVEVLSENRFGILVLGISVPLLVVSLALLLRTAEARFIDKDELEHLNAASFIAQGETLYVSFFENHPPLTPLVLQPIVRSSDDPEVVIARGRMLSFVFDRGILPAIWTVELREPPPRRGETHWF
jgi:hypothetical protein